MKNFNCPACRNTVHFENGACLRCGRRLGFVVDKLDIVAMEKGAEGDCYTLRSRGGFVKTLHYCANAAHGVCNWLREAGAPGGLCAGCRLNRTIPNLSEAGNLQAWGELEQAKRRLLYTLLRFGLSFDGTRTGATPIKFDFVRNVPTGHLDGVITIDIMEADAVERERQRQRFQEPYRTLLGHLRHESGHYYWDPLVRQSGRHDEFQALFGDDGIDYEAALRNHHQGGPPVDWQSRFVSAYASAHPFEDWAETWAHYLYMVDVLDTAEAVGLETRAAGINLGAAWPFSRRDVYREETFNTLIERWIPLTIAMNSMSRAIGLEDFYPFVISDPAREKLAFAHRSVRASLA